MATRLQEYKDKLRVVYQMTLTRKDSEFRVNFMGGKEETAYYTTDLEDAFTTAIDMRLRHDDLGMPARPSMY